MFTPLRTGPKIEPSPRIRRRHTQYRAKVQSKTCLHVVNARVLFPSPSGIAYFAMVGIECDPLLIFLTTHSTQLDNLFICNTCDTEGVPDLVRSSGRHTEDHHLLRCLAPEDVEDKALPTEQRLTRIEGCLDGMQTQLDDLTGRMGDLNGYVGDLPTSKASNSSFDR